MLNAASFSRVGTYRTVRSWRSCRTSPGGRLRTRQSSVDVEEALRTRGDALGEQSSRGFLVGLDTVRSRTDRISERVGFFFLIKYSGKDAWIHDSRNLVEERIQT